MIHQTEIRKLGKLILPEPKYGDTKLNVFPILNDVPNGGYVNLPNGYEQWEKPLNDILKHVPIHNGANQHYVTIVSQFFTTPSFLRREGVHVDGNFCVDPNFIDSSAIIKASWGGAEPKPNESWGRACFKDYKEMSDNSHVKMDWVLPYDIIIPIGTYISDKLGGIFCVSTEVGCQGWDGEFYGEIGPGGDFSSMKEQLTEDKKIVFEKDTLYFMTSNTPHETLMVEKGKRRTFMRITLNHKYPNELLQIPQIKLSNL